MLFSLFSSASTSNSLFSKGSLILSVSTVSLFSSSTEKLHFNQSGISASELTALSSSNLNFVKSSKSSLVSNFGSFVKSSLNTSKSLSSILLSSCNDSCVSCDSCVIVCSSCT
ncbi:MAG: hypothetical protein LBQ24_06125 [Candidatus Peribacteria bacterium]|nr:hypothetical protein [Candidatus Peribacteria bacterium]